MAASNPKRNTTERPWPKVKPLLIYKLSRRLWRKKIFKYCEDVILKSQSEKKIEAESVSTVATFHFIHLTYGNAKRPMAAKTLTVMDIERARWDDSGNLVIRGYTHKTAKSYGPVCLILERRVGRILIKYTKHVRILVPAYNKTNTALLTGKGSDFTNYKHYISNFLAKFKLPQL